MLLEALCKLFFYLLGVCFQRAYFTCDRDRMVLSLMLRKHETHTLKNLLQSGYFWSEARVPFLISTFKKLTFPFQLVQNLLVFPRET
jgi:hypothetical protein